MIDENKIISTLNSLFRISQFVYMNSPSLIKETEMKMFRSRLDNLNAEEICLLFKKWPEFYDKRLKEQLCQDEICNIDFESYVNSTMN